MNSLGRTIGPVLPLAALVFSASCGAQTTEVLPGEGLAVLFVGNSLTYVNGLPAMVHALADSASVRRPRIAQIAEPDYALEDHWNRGQAQREIERGNWDVVVLQQGPSALPESRVLLLDYATRFAGVIRRAGGRPAMYAVWPSLARSGDFDRVGESYALAADSVDGLLFPAGEAWRAAWRLDSTLQLYGPDAFHPSILGTYLAALVIVQRLFDVDPVGLPGTLDVRDIGRITIPPALVPLLQQAAKQANATFSSIRRSVP